jgi:hypothetical protein
MKSINIVIKTLSNIGEAIFFKFPYEFSRAFLSFNSFYLYAIFSKVFGFYGEAHAALAIILYIGCCVNLYKRIMYKIKGYDG